MYDMKIIEGQNNKIDVVKVRNWLVSFGGEIIDIKTNLFGDVIIFYDDVRRVK